MDKIWLIFWYLPVAVAFFSSLWIIIKKGKTPEAIESIVNIGLLSIAYIVSFTLFPSPRSVSHFLFKIQPDNISFGLTTFFVYLILTDFWYYLVHRLFHTVPLLWLSHRVHHSATKMNLSVTGRTSFLEYPLMTLFFLPLCLVGFSFWGVLFCRQIINLSQTFCHTEQNWPGLVDKFWITSQNHRLHHASERQLHHKNFGGLFNIWDKLFGTYVPSSRVSNYGLDKTRKR